MKPIHPLNHNSLTHAALLCLAILASWLLTACTQPAASEPPTISDPKISAPTPQEPGQEVGISVDVSSASGASLTYAWRVDGGEIVRGQGSPAITYRTPEEPGIYNVRVAVMWDDSSVEKITTIRVEAPAVASVDEPPTDTPTPQPDKPSPTATAPSPTSTLEPTATLVPATATPAPTNTPRPTPIPTATIDADPTVYDNFNNPAFDGQWNKGRWSYTGSSLVEQTNGILTLSRQSPDNGGLYHWPFTIDELGFVEAKLMLDRNIQASGGDIGVGLGGPNNWWLNCSIYSAQGGNNAWANCGTVDGVGDNGQEVEFNSWHTMRFEINPDTATIAFFVDGQQIDNYTHPNPKNFKGGEFSVNLMIWSEDGGLITGYVDDVRIGQLGQ